MKDSLLPIIRRWRADDGPDMEYVIHFRGKPVHVIRTAWAQALKRAGITRRIRPYYLRHAFATEALAAGADIRTMAELMGHADVTMILRHYQHVLDRQKKAAVEAVPDVPICAQENVPKQ
ncbi:tyrosine-type recombinase/integrase [Desulfovibrio sp. OttesenSCG-928-A18]|nr:tyrosine-type recombinase/integrase [Desulfovibrio sp. OttesenSCG-928-A18]